MRRTVARNRRARDELDRGVGQQPLAIVDARDVRKPLDESLERLRRPPRPEPDALAAGVDQALHLVVDVAVVEPDRREPQGRQRASAHSR